MARSDARERAREQETRRIETLRVEATRRLDEPQPRSPRTPRGPRPLVQRILAEDPRTAILLREILGPPPGLSQTPRE